MIVRFSNPELRRALLLGLTGVHFFLVVLGASRQWPNGALLDFYGTLSGASVAFNYFAPEIDSELRARFVLEDRLGRKTEDNLFLGLNGEARLKINTVIGFMGQAIEETSARRRLAASWAKEILRRHPEARKVTVIVEHYDLPSLVEYGDGRRPGWKPIYVSRFAGKTYAAAAQ